MSAKSVGMESILNGKKNKTPKEGRNGGPEEGIGGGGVKQETTATIRLDIELHKPTEQKTNEISYTQLLNAKTKKKVERDPLESLWGQEEEEEEKLASIAKRFEEKYGRHCNSFDRDLVDIGRGYDSGDSFVDDSELYEDYVPLTVDTVHGGFYVNTGELEFKRNSNLSDFSFSEKEGKPKPLKKQGSHITPKAILANKKLKRAKQQIASSAQKSSKSYKKKLFNNNYLTTPTSSSSLLPPDLCSATGEEDMEASDGGMSETNATCSMDESSSGSRDMTPRELPSGLSAVLSSKIQQLEEAIGKDQAGNGKLSYKAKTSYDSKLLEIDDACKPLRLKTRMAVFGYLAYKLGINRSSLSNRIKRIHKKKESGSWEGPMEELKKAIEIAMPPLLEKYNLEMEKYETERKLQESVPPPPPPLPTTDNNGLEIIDIENEDIISMEVCKTTPTIVGPSNGGSSKKLRRPSKRFHWTSEIKSLLDEVMQVKVDKELLNTNRTYSGEEIINKFIEGQIRILWPKGWVQKRTIYKMTEAIHCKLTQPDGQIPPKKTTTVKKEKGTALIEVKKEPFYEEGGVNTSLPTTPITATGTSLLEGVTISPMDISSSSMGVVSPSIIKSSNSQILVTTPPSSRSIALNNLQNQLSQLKSSNASLLSNANASSLLSNTVLGTSSVAPLITPPPATLKTDTPTFGSSSIAIVSQPTTNPLSSHILHTTKGHTSGQSSKGHTSGQSSKGGVQTTNKGGGQSSVIKKGVLKKGPSKVTKKIPTTPVSQNIFHNISKDALEAILSAIPQQLLNNTSSSAAAAAAGAGNSGGYTYTIAASNTQGSTPGVKQLVLTPSATSTAKRGQTTPTQYTTQATHQVTTPTQYVTQPTHQVTTPTQYYPLPTPNVTPPIQHITPPTTSFGGVATTLPRVLSDHHYTMASSQQPHPTSFPSLISSTPISLPSSSPSLLPTSFPPLSSSSPSLPPNNNNLYHQ